LRTRTLTAGAAIAVCLLASLTAAGPAAASAAPIGDDFNGDGFRDLAVAVPDATVNGHANAGAVVVTYGSASGPSAAKKTVLTQDSPGIPGAAEDGDHFGRSVTSADLDNDGYADLVVGSWDEDLTTGQDQGMVTIVWGTVDGYVDGGTTVLEPNGAPGAHFGRGVAVGDFDNDSRPDLAVLSSTRIWVYPKGFTRSGPIGTPKSVPGPSGNSPFSGATVNDAAAGDLTGDGADDLAVFGTASGGTPYTGILTGGSSGLTWKKDLKSGIVGDIGDLDNDGYDDLVTGLPSPTGTSDPSGGSGYIKVWYGSAGGPGGDRSAVTLTQNTADVPGASEKGDRFGAAISIGTVDGRDAHGDTYEDIAVGAPGEALGSLTDAGAVWVFKGAPGGVTGAGSQAFNQDDTGVPGAAETGDRFGGAVRVYDVTREGQAELAVTAPYENAQDGALWIFRGSDTGVTTDGMTSYDPSDFGFSSPGKRFGTALNH
jgi:FG-GAP-like repeat/FG-GAP repeat